MSAIDEENMYRHQELKGLRIAKMQMVQRWAIAPT